MRKIIWLLVAIVSIAAVACGSGDEDADITTAAATPVETPTSVPQEAAKMEPTPTVAPVPELAAVEPADGKVRGGTFNRLWADPPTLDPHLTTDTTSAGIVVEIFSGLVTLNTDLQLVPDIAERWEISEDGMVYTFFLREEAKFHDGKYITASDFKWSMERAANPKTASPVAQTYLGDIVGVDDVVDGLTTDIRGVRVIDDLTLKILQ